MTRPSRKSWPALSAVHTVALDFDGIFTDNKVYVSEKGKEFVRCDRADGLAIDLVRRFQKSGLVAADFFIISKEWNPVVSARARKLQLHCEQGIGDKLGFMKDKLAKRFPHLKDPLRGLVFLGNDLNDLSLVAAAGFSVAPADAHPKLLRAASVVLPQRGGEGFVRAFVEKFFGLDKLTVGEINELISDC